MYKPDYAFYLKPPDTVQSAGRPTAAAGADAATAAADKAAAEADAAKAAAEADTAKAHDLCKRKGMFHLQRHCVVPV